MRHAEPFLRWAGGKRWLARSLAPLIAARLGNDGTYFEPFLGSGAMFFALAPECAVLTDLNEDLINAFRMVAERSDALLEAIRSLPVNEGTYYRLRAQEPSDPLERAVRFIYLNRTCYGGIYRENKRGKFNTPYGGGSRTPAPLWEHDLLARASAQLARPCVSLKVCDFEESIDLAKQGDVIYCDPTYRAATRNQFDRYGAVIFDWADQQRLARAAFRASQRGAIILISNTYCPEIQELYSRATRIVTSKSKSIGNRSHDPNRHREYLIILDQENSNDSWQSLGLTEI
ncbi:MAG: hypothetical protein AMXMBFR16_12310 [Candidatus Uhrbacteria bacterium]